LKTPPSLAGLRGEPLQLHQHPRPGFAEADPNRLAGFEFEDVAVVPQFNGDSAHKVAQPADDLGWKLLKQLLLILVRPATSLKRAEARC
jgi:hypothetical protein